MNLPTETNERGVGIAGTVGCGGHTNAVPAQSLNEHAYAVGSVGFGPAWTVKDRMAESIVRISRELEEAQAQIAVYEAERSILQSDIKHLQNLVELYKIEVSRLVREAQK